MDSFLLFSCSVNYLIYTFHVMLHHNLANTKLKWHIGHILELVEEDLMMIGWVDLRTKRFEPRLFALYIS